MTIFFSIALLLWGADPQKESSEARNWLDERPFMGAFPLTVKDGALTAKKPKITIEVPRFKGTKFGEVSARNKGAVVKNGRITFRGLHYPQARGKAKKNHKKPSFLIDYNEPVFDKLAKEIVAQFGPKPTVEQLRLFVAGFITKKNMRRSYDVASRVAQTREGDCSEHAVLLAALARRYGHPSRTIHGLVLMEVAGQQSAAGQQYAVGHAWVEYWQKGTWHLSDAALQMMGDEKVKVTVHGYIPIAIQDNEGPGYASALLTGAFNLMGVARVIIE